MRRSVKRRVWSRVGVVAAVAVGAIGLSFAPSAGAVTSTPIGQTGANARCGTTGNWVQVSTVTPYASYVVPAGGGLITSWSATTTATWGFTMQLEVWRPAGGNNYTLVGTSPQQVEAANTGAHTYMLTPPIAAQAGDVLGFYATGTSACGVFAPPGNTLQYNTGPVPSLGATIAISNPAAHALLNITASVEQGQCGPGLTAHYSSGALGSGFDSGVWCVNGQGIGTYTQDGRIAPGRIIKVGNIIWFQAMGNNLRVSGYLNTANGASSFVETNPISATGKVLTFT